MRHFRVGQAEAVNLLVAKNLDLLDQLENIENATASGRLRRAISRAQRRYGQILDPDSRGFYHGLVTGYAVAMKVLQGKVGGRRPA